MFNTRQFMFNSYHCFPAVVEEEAMLVILGDVIQASLLTRQIKIHLNPADIHTALTQLNVKLYETCQAPKTLDHTFPTMQLNSIFFIRHCLLSISTPQVPNSSFLRLTTSLWHHLYNWQSGANSNQHKLAIDPQPHIRRYYQQKNVTIHKRSIAKLNINAWNGKIILFGTC